MKRSVHVSAPLLAGVALALNTGCRQTQMARCVDDQNHVVPDSFCDNPHQTTNYSGVPMYRPYYGGIGNYYIGSTVSGGGFTPMSGASYSTSTSRGGFGSSFGGGRGGSSGSGSGS